MRERAGEEGKVTEREREKSVTCSFDFNVAAKAIDMFNLQSVIVVVTLSTLRPVAFALPPCSWCLPPGHCDILFQ